MSTYRYGFAYYRRADIYSALLVYSPQVAEAWLKRWGLKGSIARRTVINFVRSRVVAYQDFENAWLFLLSWCTPLNKPYGN